MTARYALYFVPPPNSDLAKFGASWLGWDINRAEAAPSDGFTGLNHETRSAFVQAPRKYGFHATLKAPFRLRPETGVEDLLAAVDEIATQRFAVQKLNLKLTSIGSFLALIPVSKSSELNALAEAFVVGLETFRASMNREERARRRPDRLTENQRRYLESYGYPYVKEEYRFHMTLTGQLEQADRETAYAYLQTIAKPILATPLDITEAAVVVQEAPNDPFRVLERFALSGSVNADKSDNRGAATLFLVVGPSGVGKDSLINGARSALVDDTGFSFPQRTITRAADAGGEDHRAVSANAFAREASEGKFALLWRAHGFNYGVPAAIADDLAQGRSVIVNVSRGVLKAARRQFGNVCVLSICASEKILVTRLAGRGQQGEEDIEKHLRRAAAYSVNGSDVIEIFNDGSLEDAISRFMAVLRSPI
ncbi:MAG: phosphonate metabolism protein/1,5-bisphosphokinase (PRPP-forming) PhnN [Pseudomonadota bacterium]|nr:phosphonate metabolism protein/1,5-bisphosphokinase (PRPP-forming) PhnN [Pseudomonadota bacterium]